MTAPVEYKPTLVFQWADQSGVKYRLVRIAAPPALEWHLERSKPDSLGDDSWHFERSVTVGHERDDQDWVVVLALGLETAAGNVRAAKADAKSAKSQADIERIKKLVDRYKMPFTPFDQFDRPRIWSSSVDPTIQVRMG